MKVGDVFTNSIGESFRILSMSSWDNIEVVFEDGYTKKARSDYIRKGSIHNPNSRTIYSRGYIGEGSFNSKDRSYQCWINMFKRCYSSEYHKRTPTYIGCEVDEEWFNFQDFAKWFENNYVEGWHLDKDLKGGKKYYSKENCCFLPPEVNCSINRAYSGQQIGNGKYRVRFRKQGVDRYFDSLAEAKKFHNNKSREITIDLLHKHNIADLCKYI